MMKDFTCERHMKWNKPIMPFNHLLVYCFQILITYLSNLFHFVLEQIPYFFFNLRNDSYWKNLFDYFADSAVGVNRLLLSNPCLSSLTGRPGGLHRSSDHRSDRAALFRDARSFSLTAKALTGPEQSCQVASDHTRLWTLERGVSLALAGIIPAAFIFPSPIMDNLLAFSVTLHAHW